MRKTQAWKKRPCFSITLHRRCRPKLQRLMAGSGRKSHANVIEYLISREDETAPEWNVVAVIAGPTSEASNAR